jgi:hypothetical protein
LVMVHLLKAMRPIKYLLEKEIMTSDLKSLREEEPLKVFKP